MPETDNSLLLSILKEIRADLRDLRNLTLSHSEAFRRIDRRFDALDIRFRDLRDDLELMIKSEIMGRAAHFETAYDEKLARLEERLSEVETTNHPRS